MSDNNERKKTQAFFLIGVLILSIFLIFFIVSTIKTTEKNYGEKLSPNVVESEVIEEAKLKRQELFKVIKKKPSRPINFNALEGRIEN